MAKPKSPKMMLVWVWEVITVVGAAAVATYVAKEIIVFSSAGWLVIVGGSVLLFIAGWAAILFWRGSRPSRIQGIMAATSLVLTGGLLATATWQANIRASELTAESSLAESYERLIDSVTQYQERRELLSPPTTQAATNFSAIQLIREGDLQNALTQAYDAIDTAERASDSALDVLPSDLAEAYALTLEMVWAWGEHEQFMLDDVMAGCALIDDAAEAESCIIAIVDAHAEGTVVVQQQLSDADAAFRALLIADPGQS